MILPVLESIENPLLLVLPADHVINDAGAFHLAVEIARFIVQGPKKTDVHA